MRNSGLRRGRRCAGRNRIWRFAKAIASALRIAAVEKMHGDMFRLHGIAGKSDYYIKWQCRMLKIPRIATCQLRSTTISRSFNPHYSDVCITSGALSYSVAKTLRYPCNTDISTERLRVVSATKNCWHQCDATGLYALAWPEGNAGYLRLNAAISSACSAAAANR